MKYGLPYKGSKNKLAERILSILPNKEHFFDLFCGGCAVSHAALLRHKFKTIHINDINWMCPELFVAALEGKYVDEKRWISREDFYKLKDTDPYVAIVWSFGNNMRDYLYSREREPLKRALHYALVFDDYGPGLELGYDFSFLKEIKGNQPRYRAIKTHFFSRDEDIQSFEQTEHLARLQRLEYYVHLSFSPFSCGGTELSYSSVDYADVAIPKDSVIYCDIPYKGTNVYNTAEEFDYERFYRWCAEQQQPVFISSYELPADQFLCVAEWEHQSTLSASAYNVVKECLFIPIHQEPPQLITQGCLF